MNCWYCAGAASFPDVSLFFEEQERAGPREGEKARDSPISFLLPVIPRVLVPSFSYF